MKAWISYKSEGVPISEFMSAFRFNISRTIEKLGDVRLVGLQWIDEPGVVGWSLEYEAK